MAVEVVDGDMMCTNRSEKIGCADIVSVEFEMTFLNGAADARANELDLRYWSNRKGAVLNC